MSEEPVDVLIVGAGAAGAAVAWSLADTRMPGLVMRTYMAYYSNDRVLEALGLEPRPPHPGGYAMEPNDLSLLDDVRRRAKLYRKC